MIPKGLKVGDTFVDGNSTYKVTKVDGDLYESERVGKASPVAPSVQPVKILQQVKEEEPIDYSTVPYAQLKKLCADKGLDAKGTKEELIARLEG
jgi:hypothetical protein